ncbi:hypothetical protein CLV71_104191 [Actinophytocola oryzae]|uniref:Uncharacterized protein n=1 Tax=Actinophytocola oryzae TaxID=502181 RepID=A0A4R7VUR3_9PSEU|nr:hypothetical protein CLV71_104191 [Actinophytocola oryzae]
MDRRGFLRVAGTAVASGCLPASTEAAGATEPPQWHRYWRECLTGPETHPLVPNVSHAGYRYGERPLPTSPIGVGVTSLGARGVGHLPASEPRKFRESQRVLVDVAQYRVPLKAGAEPAVYPTNPYEAQLRHRLRGTR